MPLDPSIALSIKPVQLDDPIAKQQQIQTMRLHALQAQQAQRQEQQQLTLADLYRNNTGSDGAVNSQGMLQGMAERGLGSQIPGFQKQIAETKQAQAALGKTNIETDASKFKLDKDRLNATNGMLASLLARPNVTHDDVIKGIGGIVQSGLATPEQGAQVIRSLPGRPEDLRGFLMERGVQGMDEAKRMELLTPKFEKMDLGGTVQPGTVNQMTGQFTPGGAAVNKTVSPDAVLSANTSTKNAQLAASTSTANNRANIQKEYNINGINPDGSPMADLETTARMIAEGKVTMPERSLATARGQRIMSLVNQINPDYDASTVAAKRKAANDFASGTLGNALRSVSTANAHLDQLSGLVDAMNNGDYQLVNKAKNAYATATGQTAPSNFDAIKHIVGQEVVKAIVAGGGSAGERDEAGKIFSNVGSPQQLKQAIGQYRLVMGAQADNLMEQRRAAGLPDSTLPNYKSHSAAEPTVPPEIAALLKKHGGNK